MYSNANTVRRTVYGVHANTHYIYIYVCGIEIITNTYIALTMSPELIIIIDYYNADIQFRNVNGVNIRNLFICTRYIYIYQVKQS